jgi:oxygen-dependent protoporphyrinogen oxidase
MVANAVPPPLVPHSPRAPIAIVGAGLAGLVAARELRRGGQEFIVFEPARRVGGLATSHHDDQGFSYDTGAHFITNRLAAAVGVAGDCRVVRRYGESVWLRGRDHSYPFGLLGVPRYAASAVRTRVRRRREPQNAAEWFRNEYGRALADEVALPLLEAWSGVHGEHLSAAVAQKLPSSVVETVGLKLAARTTRRAIAIGYCREQPQSIHVFHVYPEHGLNVLTEKLAAETDGRIRFETPVERILVEDDRVVAVRAGGEEIPVRGVVSTAPVNILADLVEGTSVLEPYRQFQYRPMVFVNLRFEGRGLLPDTVTWTPEQHLPFFRLTEAPMSMPWLAPAGKTMITADIGAEVGDDVWRMDEDTAGELCVSHLMDLVPDARRRFCGARIVKTPIAYPVYLGRYEQARRDLSVSTGVEGLLSVGRNGEFSHMLMEDVYWRTLSRVHDEILRANTRESGARRVIPA